MRAFEPDNLGDIERVNLMFYHPAVMKAKGYFRQGYVVESERDLHEVSRDMFCHPARITRQKRDVVLAVTDRESGVLGWIWFYRDSSHPLPQRVQTELGISERKGRIYQLSYEKLLSNGWPAKILEKTRQVTPSYLQVERKGVIVEGLRIAILRLRRQFRTLYGLERKLVLYAFVDPSNISSSLVLQKNGFTRISRKYKYDGVPQNLWVRVV